MAAMTSARRASVLASWFARSQVLFHCLKKSHDFKDFFQWPRHKGDNFIQYKQAISKNSSSHIIGMKID